MKKNVYKFKINYTLLGGMQAIRQPEYGDIVEIIRDGAILVGIVYDIDNRILGNSLAFIRNEGYRGDFYRLGSNYTIIDPSPNLNRQIIANDFEAWWWYTPNSQDHIRNWNLIRPPDLQPPQAPPDLQPPQAPPDLQPPQAPPDLQPPQAPNNSGNDPPGA